MRLKVYKENIILDLVTTNKHVESLQASKLKLNQHTNTHHDRHDNN